jgi:uncharacterized phage-like protein YoqJ
MIIAGTGHRLDKLGGYGKDIADFTYAVASEYLEHNKPDVVISGMAIGWDQALAIAAHKLGIEWWAYVPFPGQEKRWPQLSQQLYNQLLSAAHNVVYIQPHYHPGAFQQRNVLMVDHCDEVVALWNGEKKGGTYNCLEYAEKKFKPVTNLWSRYENIRHQSTVCSTSQYKH